MPGPLATGRRGSRGWMVALGSPVMDERSDADLVLDSVKGDTAAFDELVRRYSGQIYGMLARLVGDAALAEDAAQETFLRAWRAIGRFRGDAKFTTWLYRIAMNKGNRILAREARRELVLYEDVMAEVPGLGANTHSRAETAELRAQIESALAELPEHYRAAILLRDVEGFSNEEAADILELNIRNFRSRLHRGRMALRERLEAQERGAASTT